MCHFPECLITCAVAISVVVVLEMIDVDHSQAEGDSASFDMAASLLECVVKTATVGYPGQCIL